MKIKDSQLYAVFAAMLDGSGRAEIRPDEGERLPYTVALELEVHDNHRGDSPDVILQVLLTIEHPQLPALEIQIHVPIEGEKAGIAAAIEDLRKFIEREHFVQKIPMLVIGGSGNPARRTQRVQIPARVEITQIPYRLVSPS
jgi:hypothetical protein